MEKFNFQYLDMDIQQNVSAQDYNRSVTSTVEKLMETLSEVFKQSGLTPDKVDQVCLTGGTSQFLPIRHELKSMFGDNKITEHNIFESVVNGPANYGKQLMSHS